MAAVYFSEMSDLAAYLSWQTQNPNGFVLNTRKKPGSDYLVLHRVGASCLNRPNPTKSYSKLCGSKDDITAFVSRVLALDPKAIRICARCGQ